ncbi:MAG: type II secretion system F family protein [Dermatophilaceae bacterium]
MADALEVVASALRAGLSPTAALALMAEATSWGAHEGDRIDAVRSRMRVGGSTAQAWCRPTDSDSAAASYRAVARLWDLALQTGGPFADAVDGIAVHLREEARLRGRLEGLAAGPRTSRRLLTALPLAGPALAVVVGADLKELYASSVPGAASVLTGVVLTVAGWLWSRSMVEQATRMRPYPVDAAEQAAHSRPRQRRPDHGSGPRHPRTP